MNDAATKKDLKNLENKMDGKFSRWAKVIGEDFSARIKPVIEMQQEQGKKIDRLNKKMDAVYEMVAKNSVDIEIIKTKISQIEQDIQQIKKTLKSKADAIKIEKLEKEILILKQKVV